MFTKYCTFHMNLSNVFSVSFMFKDEDMVKKRVVEAVSKTIEESCPKTTKQREVKEKETG